MMVTFWLDRNLIDKSEPDKTVRKFEAIDLICWADSFPGSQLALSPVSQS